jgi:hypothetical protein
MWYQKISVRDCADRCSVARMRRNTGISWKSGGNVWSRRNVEGNYYRRNTPSWAAVSTVS